MKQDLLASLRAAVVALLAFTVLTGILYPALVLGIGQAVFGHRANGSLLESGGRIWGSELVGQHFTNPAYFWGRPSALTPFQYNAMSSVASNLGPSDGHGKPNPALRTAVSERIDNLRAADPDNRDPVPADLVTTSASGLDPHISPAAARYQIARVARARKLSIGEVDAMVEAHVEERTLGILGERRVNVLLLNQALDAKAGPPRAP